MKLFAKINKEYKDLSEIVDTFKAYKNTASNIANAKLMLQDTDPEMKEMAELEISDLQPQLVILEEKINYLFCYCLL